MQMGNIMTDAPKRSTRQRTATKKFEYQRPPGNVPDDKGSKSVDGGIGINEEEALTVDDQATGGGKGKPRPTQGKQKSDADHQPPELNVDSPPRKRLRHTKSDFVVWSDDPDDSRSEGQTTNSDNGTERTKDTTPDLPTPGKTVSQIVNTLSESDYALEQHYADPYQRHRPDVKIYDIWRRENLETLLRDKGLTVFQAQSIASWLQRCEKVGLHPYGTSPPRKVQKTPSGSKRGSAKPPSDQGRKVGSYRFSDEHGSQVGNVQHDHEDNLDADADESSVVSSTAPGSITTDYQKLFESVPQKIPQAPKGLSSAEYEDLSEEEQIEHIKAQLNIFNFVYGEDRPQQDPNKWEQKLDYLSFVTKRPRSVPKGGFRTQGHFQLQLVTLPADDPALYNHIIAPASYEYLPKHALNHGLNFNQTVPHPREVLTEDPNFGITRYPANETETPEGLKAYNEERRVKYRSRQEIANDKCKTKEEIREEEAEAAEAESERARKELAILHWDWETSDSIKGYWVDVDAGQTKFDPTTFASGTIVETWKQIQARMEILARGGEEADQLIQKEREEEKREIERQKRREQTQRSRMYKLERMQK